MYTKESLIQDLIKDGHLKTPRIIEAFRAIDRVDFVPYEFQHEAYGNYPLFIGFGQTVSQPLTVAFMLELLQPQSGDKVLDVGFGSGWTTALLAQIVGKKGTVIAAERIPEICGFGGNNIAKYDFIDRIKLICGDGTRAMADAPFDKILVGAASSGDIPSEWRQELKVGGRIVAPVDNSVVVFNKKTKTEWDEIQYPGFSFVPLISDEHQKPKTKSYAFAVKRPADKEARRKHQISITRRYRKKYLLIALIAGLLVSGIFVNEVYLPHASFAGSKSIEIPRGFGSGQIAEFLKNEGVIRSKWALLTYITFTFRSSSLKPGDYVFGNESISQISQKLILGGTNEKILVVPEGWNSRDIGIYLENLGMFQREEFLEFVGFPKIDYSENRDFSAPEDFSGRFEFLADKSSRVGLEGYLFPDTYRIFKEATAEDVVLKMLANFGRKLSPEFIKEINNQKKTIFEIITMASLIEKEVVSDEDRAVVSGILWKRFEAGVPLQVDATITYITEKKSTKVTRADTQIDSPFNTYKYRGLPLGPISNPGVSAIRAAIYPKSSPYWFYLSAPDGTTVFSKTIEEHNEAKARYLK